MRRQADEIEELQERIRKEQSNRSYLQTNLFQPRSKNLINRGDETIEKPNPSIYEKLIEFFYRILRRLGIVR